MSVTRATAVGLVCMLLFAAGCSSDANPDIAGERPLEERVLGSGPGDVADDWVAECMAKAGFGDLVTKGSDLNLDRASHGSEESWVKEHGYGIVELVLVQVDATPDALSEQVAAMDPETADAFTTAHTGCMIQYLEEHETTQAPQDLQEAYVRMLREEVVADERYVALEQQWVNCMKLNGFDYRNQNDPKTYFSDIAATAPELDRDQLEREFEEEKRVALQDVRCRQPLDDQFDAIVDEYETRFEQTYANELANR